MSPPTMMMMSSGEVNPNPELNPKPRLGGRQHDPTHQTWEHTCLPGLCHYCLGPHTDPPALPLLEPQDRSHNPPATPLSHLRMRGALALAGAATHPPSASGRTCPCARPAGAAGGRKLLLGCGQAQRRLAATLTTRCLSGVSSDPSAQQQHEGCTEAPPPDEAERWVVTLSQRPAGEDRLHVHPPLPADPAPVCFPHSGPEHRRVMLARAVQYYAEAWSKGHVRLLNDIMAEGHEQHDV